MRLQQSNRARLFVLAVGGDLRQDSLLHGPGQTHRKLSVTSHCRWEASLCVGVGHGVRHAPVHTCVLAFLHVCGLRVKRRAWTRPNKQQIASTCCGWRIDVFCVWLHVSCHMTRLRFHNSPPPPCTDPVSNHDNTTWVCFGHHGDSPNSTVFSFLLKRSDDELINRFELWLKLKVFLIILRENWKEERLKDHIMMYNCRSCSVVFSLRLRPCLIGLTLQDKLPAHDRNFRESTGGKMASGFLSSAHETDFSPDWLRCCGGFTSDAQPLHTSTPTAWIPGR